MGNPARKKRSMEEVTPDELEKMLSFVSKHKSRIVLDDSIAPLPPEAVKVLMRTLEFLSHGKSVELIEVNDELSTQEAAELLNVSRPFVVKLIDEGALPARMVGSHRRVLRGDVLKYQATQNKSRKAALDEMTRLNQEMGLE